MSLYDKNDIFYTNISDLVISETLPIGINVNKSFRRFKGLGTLCKDMIYDVFFNPVTRRLVQVTPEGIDYAMSLTENIDVRKKLLIDSGILSNPFKLKD